jgi:hypothetical protein
MAKFNTATTVQTRPAVAVPAVPAVSAVPAVPAKGNSPVVAVGAGVTHEGGQGFVRDVKSELFLLAVTNLVGEATFYENAEDRDARFERLVRQATVEDPQWTAAMLGWLRAEGNLRSAPLVGAAIFAHERLAQGLPGMSRQLVDAVLQRADEPGELLAYWVSTFGRAVPKPVKRGIADAAVRLYNERSMLKYDTGTKGFRFGDVIDVVHPRASTPSQSELFKYALDRRHGRADEVPESLGMVRRNAALRASDVPADWLDDKRLREAGMTWEDALSAVGSTVDRASLWKAMIPSMGYMALLRNLRNFDEAGVPDRVAERVAKKLADPAEVSRSRQFPFRFLAAYERAPSQRWAHALDLALQESLSNVPVLDGRSLVLIDTSASMTSLGWSRRSKVTPAKAAAVFGMVLAIRCGADVYGFANGVFKHEVRRGASALREIERFLARTGEVGHGTEIAASLQRTWKGHNRVFIISDMQTMDGNTTGSVPGTVALYGFNLGGYRVGAIDAGKTNRIEFGGLTDAAFRMVPLIEDGRKADWPWM